MRSRLITSDICSTLPRQTALTGKFKQSARLQGRAGGRMLLPACASECKYFSLYVILVGTQPEKERQIFRGVWGSQSSGVRELWFSLHQPKCPRICPASQTPLHFLELLCQSVIQSYTVLLPKIETFLKGLRCGCVRGRLVQDGKQRINMVVSLLSWNVPFIVATQKHRKASMKHPHNFTLA